MERNYQKEVALANKKIAELQELVHAYQALYDDALEKLSSKDGEEHENDDYTE